MADLSYRALFRLSIDLWPTQEIGCTPAGERRIFPVSGGSFEGDRLRGEVLPHAGADHLIVGGDGVFRQDVRLTLKTDDGALILMTYRGIRHASEEVSARIARGETVSASEYYLRTAPFFETASDEYAWLNRMVTVGIGERRSGGVEYQVYEIL